MLLDGARYADSSVLFPPSFEGGYGLYGVKVPVPANVSRWVFRKNSKTKNILKSKYWFFSSYLLHTYGPEWPHLCLSRARDHRREEDEPGGPPVSVQCKKLESLLETWPRFLTAQLSVLLIFLSIIGFISYSRSIPYVFLNFFEVVVSMFLVSLNVLSFAFMSNRRIKFDPKLIRVQYFFALLIASQNGTSPSSPASSVGRAWDS